MFSEAGVGGDHQLFIKLALQKINPPLLDLILLGKCIRRPSCFVNSRIQGIHIYKMTV